jgi:hypothetical protein
MRHIAKVLIDEAHRQAWSICPDRAALINAVSPHDASYARASTILRHRGLDVVAHQEGVVSPELLSGVDVLVLPHCSDDSWERTIAAGSPIYTPDEIAAIEKFVASGGGLIILAETEQAKYGNNLAEIAARFGIEIENSTVQDPHANYRGVATWISANVHATSGENITSSVREAVFYRSGTLRSTETDAVVFASSSTSSHPASAPLAMIRTAANGRVAVFADSDLFGDDSISEADHERLWINTVAWAAGGKMHHVSPASENWTINDENWASLATAVEEIRPFTGKDGAVDLQALTQERANEILERIIAAIEGLAPRFAHQAEHLEATIKDLRTWAEADFGVPDFLDSLQVFRPDLNRGDGIENLVLFPMYTQNGNLNRNLEAVIVRTFWPDWLAELEASHYNNAAFLPIEFVAFTAGYQTHSAVLFPETVATRSTPVFYWGAIFCDREAARFRRVTRAAVDLLKISLPPEAARLIDDQTLAQETYVLWDLIHDRTHSHGELPFDPFMIKQRMPFWMYALEELRCDLNTYRETLELDERGIFLGRYIRYAIVFDRLFRFPITGTRIRNYDGLGGQIIFGWLHRRAVVQWRDNTLSFDWDALDGAVVELCEAVERLYREGIDRSKVGHWIAAHSFVSEQVPAHPASSWANAQTLPLEGESKELVNLVLADEFPLNVFYEALRKKLSDVVESTAGITA